VAKTPGGGSRNNTIHTPTPSRTVGGAGFKRALNQTIGTPGKRARGEVATPRVGQLMRPAMTSTQLKSRPPVSGRQNQLAREPEVGAFGSSSFADLSAVSMIGPPDDDLPEGSIRGAGGSSSSCGEAPDETRQMTGTQLTLFKAEIRQTMQEEIQFNTVPVLIYVTERPMPYRGHSQFYSQSLVLPRQWIWFSSEIYFAQFLN
jgi:hypothetical protein